MRPPATIRRLVRGLVLSLKPNQRLALTREGRNYLLVWLALMAVGLYLQSNLILLIAGLAAGPLVASIVLSAEMLQGLRVERRLPGYAFAGEPLAVDYVLENGKRWTALLATFVEDELVPGERTVPGAVILTPRLAFARVPAGGRDRVRWEGTAPARGKYSLERLRVITRAPFGLLERRLIVAQPDELIVYPRVGQIASARRPRATGRADRPRRAPRPHGA